MVCEQEVSPQFLLRLNRCQTFVMLAIIVASYFERLEFWRKMLLSMHLSIREGLGLKEN